uniref:60S ribosomal protein L28 n=1 Tax=Ciona savignyi TaxID=51511 RepID=H2YNC5_CIOSA
MLGQLKSRVTSPSRFHTSRNKYCVVKDKGALRLQYKHHRLHRVFMTKQSASVATRYKLVKPTMQATTSQTRSRKSGNIVLRRKQGEVLVVPVAKPSPHHYSVKHKLASQALQRSIQTIRSKNRNKVLRKFCIFYNR